MTDTPSSGAESDEGPGGPYAQPAPDSEPIEAEFKPADPEPAGASRGGPGWTGAMALAVLAAIGGSVGGTFGARLLGGAMPAGEESAGAAMVEALREETGRTTRDLVATTAALSTRADANEASLEATQEGLNRLREAVGELEKELGQLERLNSLERRLAALESASQSGGGEEGAAGLALGALAGRVEALEGEAAALTRATTTLREATQGLDLPALQAAIAGLEAEMETLAETRAAAAASALPADLALALADLTRAAGAGESFAGPHADLAAALPGDPHITALAPLAGGGVPTPDRLASRFDALLPAARAADPRTPEGGIGLAERLFGDQIKVRRDGEISVDDQLAAASGALAEGDVAAALAATRDLPEPVRAVLQPWREGAEARLDLEQAIDGLRQSLSAGAPDARQTRAGEAGQ